MLGVGLALSLVFAQFAPSGTGELRITVTDATGLRVPAATVAIVSAAHQVDLQLDTNAEGVVVARRLPFGAYHIRIERTGFAPLASTVEVASALPTEFHATLVLDTLSTAIGVTATVPALDAGDTSAVQRLGAKAIAARPTALPGRSVPELVNTQPGWLLEANGILHPRGSEYQTQFVVDGLPLTDNRSPAFAPEIDADDLQGMTILTGGYPAEYGRKLGGVIEVASAVSARHGFHGDASISGGSFDTAAGDAAAGYSGDRTTVTGVVGAARTDRYLDPPVEENYTNEGRVTHGSVRVEHDVSDSDRAGVIVRYGKARFQVPNERVQEDAGQLQERSSRESAVQASYQRIVSTSWLVDVRALARDLSADLQSNAASTPIVANQQRGIRELYVNGAVTRHHGIHEWKFGGDANFGRIHEAFDYIITDPDQFSPETPQTFAFADAGDDREQAAFVQDRVRLGSWTANLGVRWDHYRLRVDEHAISPRVGIAWSWPAADLVVRASYDRAFQTPAVENLLLASSPALDSLNDAVVRLPVRPSRGDFYQVGVSKMWFRTWRLDATWYDRSVTNFADDDLLLNTGISFPIAFSRADVHGVELKADVANWRSLTGSVSYSWMRGVGELPVTGGLFLGDEASTLSTSSGSFPVSQDQRHTLRGRLAWQTTARTWVAAAASYGSGLPVEFDGDPIQALAQYGPRIVGQVDFEDGRVDPSFSLDLSASWIMFEHADRSLRVQVDVRNLTDRLNVINFAGLFSGTALAPPRSAAVRVRAGF